MAPRKPRRRVTRTSPEDYDRSADEVVRVAEGADALRTVELDEHASPELQGKAFWEEQRPPHYGGQT